MNPAGAPQLDSLKQRAAEAALRCIQSGMVVGLGSGSTASLFITGLGQEIRLGRLSSIRGVPTSEASGRLAAECGVPVVSFADVQRCDLAVDGADEIDPQLNLVKGLGGALLREKIVAQNSDRVVIVAEEAKLVERLGSKCPLPVEVVGFGMERLPDFFRSLGGEAALRMTAPSRPFVTDSGNFIFDVRFGPIGDLRALEIALLQRAGVVQTGLFLEIAHDAIIATTEGVRTFSRA